MKKAHDHHDCRLLLAVPNINLPADVRIYYSLSKYPLPSFVDADGDGEGTPSIRQRNSTNTEDNG